MLDSAIIAHDTEVAVFRGKKLRLLYYSHKPLDSEQAEMIFSGSRQEEVTEEEIVRAPTTNEISRPLSCEECTSTGRASMM